MVSLKNETKYPNNLKKHNCRYRRIIKIIILLKKTFVKKPIIRGRGTGEAGEATASPEFRGVTTEKFLAS